MRFDDQSLQTLRDFVRWGASRFNKEGLFYGHGTDNALDEALSLVLHAVHLDHDLPETYLEARVTDEERNAILELFSRRVDERVPTAYLTGRARFAGLEFRVDEHVLVPRSPIAELIEQGFSPWLNAAEVEAVLDLCTGSACIAIGCAYAFPDARVDAVDVSPAALAVARLNVTEHHLLDRVDVIESDLFASLEGRTYDLIVSNPPYVAEDDLDRLPPEYGWEPELGLAAGREGLDVVIRILRQGGRFLEPDGIMVVEVGAAAPALMARYPEVPFLWLEFERGGEGVFLLTADQLDEYQAVFDER
jgi:ribosomal protein L3 glutamine methyltransferase